MPYYYPQLNLLRLLSRVVITRLKHEDGDQTVLGTQASVAARTGGSHPPPQFDISSLLRCEPSQLLVRKHCPAKEIRTQRSARDSVIPLRGRKYQQQKQDSSLHLTPSVTSRNKR